jgi:sugar phosphate isomerase/epimerase
MKFTLNTLGAPGWTLEEAAQRARAYGYSGIDLRLIDGEVISLESVRANRARVRAVLQDGLAVSVLGTSVRLAGSDPNARRQAEDEVSQWIDLAAELGIPVIRVYGGKPPEGLDLEAAAQVVAESLSRVAPRAEQAGIAVGVETHDDFSSAKSVGRAVGQVPSRAIGAVWDMYHTTRMGESPAEVLSVIGDRLLNVHLKDARRTSDGWELRLLGEGDIPVKEALRLLIQRGYQDFVSVEWEKKWHPELAEPEVAFPQHIQLLDEYIRELEPSAISHQPSAISRPCG